jgi:hypothetical protein
MTEEIVEIDTDIHNSRHIEILKQLLNEKPKSKHTLGSFIKFVQHKKCQAVNPNVSCVELVDKMTHITIAYIDLVDTDVNFAFADVIVHFLKANICLKDCKIDKFETYRD